MIGEMRELTFSQTLKEKEHLLRGYLYNKVNNQEDRDDLYQDIVGAFWEFLERFDGDCVPSTALYRIMYNKVGTYIRKKVVREKYSYDSYGAAMMRTPMFKINLLLHPMWRKHLTSTQEGLLLALRKTLERTNGTLIERNDSDIAGS